jgi:glycosyltransferase involved in cell wall biosynthesis
MTRTASRPKSHPTVSIITPTYLREDFHARILRYFKWQTYPGLEWLVLDDSPTPSAVLSPLNDPAIRYEHAATRLSVGEKRNRLIERARGELILHFDDDDFYAPGYVEFMVGELVAKDVDLLNLRGWFIYDRRHSFFGYWNLEVKEGLHYVINDEGVNPMIFNKLNNGPLTDNELGYAAGWAYRKTVWQAAPFSDRDWNEDGPFALKAREKFRLAGTHDSAGICMHLRHPSNVTQQCFAQYRFPEFLLPKIFPGFGP